MHCVSWHLSISTLSFSPLFLLAHLCSPQCLHSRGDLLHSKTRLCSSSFPPTLRPLPPSALRSLISVPFGNEPSLYFLQSVFHFAFIFDFSFSLVPHIRETLWNLSKLFGCDLLDVTVLRRSHLPVLLHGRVVILVCKHHRLFVPPSLRTSRLLSPRTFCGACENTKSLCFSGVFCNVFFLWVTG